MGYLADCNFEVGFYCHLNLHIYFTVFYQVQPLVVKVAMKAKQSVPFYDALLVSIMLNSNGACTSFT